jgi:hypothetical protein
VLILLIIWRKGKHFFFSRKKCGFCSFYLERNPEASGLGFLGFHRHPERSRRAAFHSNLFSIALGLNPRQLKKGFPLQMQSIH